MSTNPRKHSAHAESEESLAANAMSTPPSTPIVIVGMAVELPGANNTEALWKLLADGLNTVTKVRTYHPPKATRN